MLTLWVKINFYRYIGRVHVYENPSLPHHFLKLHIGFEPNLRHIQTRKCIFVSISIYQLGHQLLELPPTTPPVCIYIIYPLLHVQTCVLT